MSGRLLITTGWQETLKTIHWKCYSGVYDMILIHWKCCRGVYDMILDSNRLIASVYDTIQVWDLSTYQMTNLLNPKSLDSPNAATTCFAVLRDKLVESSKL